MVILGTVWKSVGGNSRVFQLRFECSDFISEPGGFFVIFLFDGFPLRTAELHEAGLILGPDQQSARLFSDVLSIFVDVFQQWQQLGLEVRVVLRASEATVFAEFSE